MLEFEERAVGLLQPTLGKQPGASAPFVLRIRTSTDTPGSWCSEKNLKKIYENALLIYGSMIYYLQKDRYNP